MTGGYRLQGTLDPVTYYLHMTVKTWLENASQDAERRGLPALKPLLEALARSTTALRAAEWNGDATGQREGASNPDGR